MVDATYVTKVYTHSGGDEQVVASGGVLRIESGGKLIAGTAQHSALSTAALLSLTTADLTTLTTTQLPNFTTTQVLALNTVIANVNSLVVRDDAQQTSLNGLITVNKALGTVA